MLSTSTNLHNLDNLMASPDNYHKLVYYNIGEIGMGGPFGVNVI